jgi:predicted MFS family arabinose efflux permease
MFTARSATTELPLAALLALATAAFTDVSHLRSVLIAALTLVVAALLALGLTGRDLGAVLAAAALWGAAFGGVPALLQTALISASGPGYADMATSLQTTVYNIGIAAGSLVGGLVLQGAGAPALPWAASVLIAAALAIVSCRRVGLRRGSPELTGPS